MSFLLMLVGEIRLRKSDDYGHIGGSAYEVVCEPQTSSVTYTAWKN